MQIVSVGGHENSQGGFILLLPVEIQTLTQAHI